MIFSVQKFIGNRVHSWVAKQDMYEYTFHQKLFGWACTWRSNSARQACVRHFTGTVGLYHPTLVHTVTKLCNSQRSIIPQSVRNASHYHTDNIYIQVMSSPLSWLGVSSYQAVKPVTPAGWWGAWSYSKTKLGFWWPKVSTVANCANKYCWRILTNSQWTVFPWSSTRYPTHQSLRDRCA